MSKPSGRTEKDEAEYIAELKRDHEIQAKVCVEQRDELKRLREYIVQLLDSNLNLSGQLRIALERVEPALEHNRKHFAGMLEAEGREPGHTSPSGLYKWNFDKGWHEAREED